MVHNTAGDAWDWLFHWRDECDLQGKKRLTPSVAMPRQPDLSAPMALKTLDQVSSRLIDVLIFYSNTIQYYNAM